MKKTKFLIYFFFSVLLMALIFSLKFSYISADAPYYLSVARDISEGLVPYKNISLAYTPLMMYLNSFIYKMYGNPNYSFFLAFQYLFIAISAWVLYKISRRFFQIDKERAFLLIIFYILAVLSSDGIYINLEVYSGLCVLLGILFYFKKNLFWTGFFLGISFFFKQYGLLNFVPFFLILTIRKQKRQRQIISLVSGGLVPLILFLVYFIYLKNVNFSEIFNQISGKAYLFYSSASTDGITEIILGAKVFLLLLLPLLFLSKRINNSEISILLITGVLINLIPVFLQSFQHYYLNTFPFLFLFIAMRWKEVKARFIISLSFSMLIIAGLLFTRIYRYRNLFIEQKNMASQVSKIYPLDSKVFAYGKVRYLYLINNYKNPLVSEIGYTYPYKPSKNLINKVNIISNSEILNIEPDEVIDDKSHQIFIYKKKVSNREL